MQPNPKLIARFWPLCLILLLVLHGCLKDDFSKLAQSEWNPDLAFPLVNSTMTAKDILANDDSPTVISATDEGIVEIIYSSLSTTERASELIFLPLVEESNTFGPSSTNFNAFNSNQTLGFSIEDSVQYSIPYSLDNQLGSTSRLDTVFFKSGKLNLDIQSVIPHTSAVTVEIPNLYINNQIYRQVVPLIYTNQPTTSTQIERNLTGAYLVPNPGTETITIKYKFTVVRENAQSIPTINCLSSDLSFTDVSFGKLSGLFGNYSASLSQNDTLFMHIFRNVISAQNLQFINPKARIVVSNSTGIPIDYTQNSFSAFRPGTSIPSVDISGFSFPDLIAAQEHTSTLASQYSYAFEQAIGSNISTVINLFPRYLLSRGNYAFNYTQPTASYFLRDTSRVSVYSEVSLPLDGLTLDLQVRDTLEFQFKSISQDVEEIMLRLNIINGFPTDGNLQVYFCKQLPGSNQAIQIIDSLYVQGTEPVLLPGETGANGTVTIPSQKITDAIIDRQKWLKLYEFEADRILIKARLTTYDLGQLAVKVLENDELKIRISARIKAHKSF